MTTKQEELLSTATVAAELGKSIWTVARLAKAGKLKPATPDTGAARFFARPEVERYKRTIAPRT